MATIAAGVPAFAFQASPEREGDKVVCKRETVTGSLVKSKRTCMTRDEWRNLQDTTRDQADRFIRDTTNMNPPRG